jgi:hypothetical protein
LSVGTAERFIVASRISSDGDGSVGTRLALVGAPHPFATDATGHAVV